MSIHALMALSDSAARSLAKSAVVERAKARLVVALSGAAPKAKAGLSKVRAVLMSFVFALALTPSAFAGETGSTGTGTAGDILALVGATDTIASMMSKVWEIMMDNPLLTVFMAGSLLSMGIGFFMYLKKAARH